MGKIFNYLREVVSDPFIAFSFGIATGVVSCMQCVNHADYLRIGDRKTIPHLSEAQEGFIPTSNLWIDAADSDGVGGLETIFFVDELSSCSPRDSPTARLYGIIWDANGEPDLVPYRVGTEE